MGLVAKYSPPSQLGQPPKEELGSGVRASGALVPRGPHLADGALWGSFRKFPEACIVQSSAGAANISPTTTEPPFIPSSRSSEVQEQPLAHSTGPTELTA